MKKNVSQRIIKSMMTFMMAAAFFASPTTILANDVAGNEDAKEATEKAVDPGIDNFDTITIAYDGYVRDELTASVYDSKLVLSVALKDQETKDAIEQFYTVEWKLNEKITKKEDQSDAKYVYDLAINAEELGVSTVSVTITSKNNPTITKTISKEVTIGTTRGSFMGKTEKINVEDIVKSFDSGKYDSYNLFIDPAVNPIISKEIIAKAKEKNVDLDFILYNGDARYPFGNYNLDAKDIEYTDMDLNLAVSINVDTKEISDEFAKNYKPLIIEFAHNGNLPGKMNINLWVNDWYTENFGTTWIPNFYLYHINEETLKLEPSGTVSVGQGYGYGIAFSITHCSKYALTETELTEAALDLNVKQVSETPVQVLDNQPNTGV